MIHGIKERTVGWFKNNNNNSNSNKYLQFKAKNLFVFVSCTPYAYDKIYCMHMMESLTIEPISTCSHFFGDEIEAYSSGFLYFWWMRYHLRHQEDSYTKSRNWEWKFGVFFIWANAYFDEIISLNHGVRNFYGIFDVVYRY